MREKEEEREKNEEEQTDVGRGGEVDVGRLRNVVGAEIRGIGGIMGGILPRTISVCSGASIYIQS